MSKDNEVIKIIDWLDNNRYTLHSELSYIRIEHQGEIYESDDIQSCIELILGEHK